MKAPLLAQAVEKRLRCKQVYQKQSPAAIAERLITVSNQRIHIHDRLETGTKARIARAIIARDAVHLHGHCTRFLESLNAGADLILTREQLAELNAHGSISLERTLELVPTT